MCELMYIQKVGDESLNQDEIKNFCYQVLEGAEHNKNSWGAFNDTGKTLKCKSKFVYDNIKEVVEYFEGSKYIVMHLRLSTSGDLTKAHPFSMNGFLLSHNGMVNSQYFEELNVDSEEILKLIVRQEGTTFEKIDTFGIS